MTELMIRATAASRARNGDLLVFAASGFILATWMSRIPDVRDMLHLSSGQLGLLLLALSGGALCGLPVAGHVTARVGALLTVRRGMLVTMLGAMLTAGALRAGWPVHVVATGLFLSGLGSGIWDVAQNLQGTVIERAVDRALMPWFHAAFSAGTVAAAMIGALLVQLHVALDVHVAFAAAVCAGAVWWGSGLFLPSGSVSAGVDPASPGSVPVRSAWTEPRTLLIGLMVLAAGFAEGTANDWIAVVFVDGHGVSPAVGVVALAVFLAFMTAGRILGTSMLDRYGRIPVLRVFFAAAIVGCLLVVFGTAGIAVAGAAIWGVGASLGFPVGMSAAADDPQRAHARLSVVSTIGYTAFLGGPPLVGFLGDRVGVLRALLIVGLISVVALFVLPAAEPLADRARPRS